jgi:spore coat polysaccharide biosynthesis protein SpsF
VKPLKTAIIIQARMGSTRLPGKVLKPVLDKPLLEYQIERLRRVKNADAVVLATSTLGGDDPLAAFARRLEVPCYRGSESDVLSRYYHCAKEIGADVVVRSTADCPLIDPGLMEKLIAGFLADGRFQYGSNATIDRTYPRGLDSEIFTFRALEEAFREAKTPFEREHVTPFITAHRDRFPALSQSNQENLGHLRWTVDTPEDFELIKRILEALYPTNPSFTWKDVLVLLKAHPDWPLLNAHIEQKKA